ncbi:MAG TPA: hypothetical protein VII24_15915, partial [Pseudolabrys sp.]
CELILEHRSHPEQGFRACLGIVRLARPYGTGRLEAAANRAIEIGARTAARLLIRENPALTLSDIVRSGTPRSARMFLSLRHSVLCFLVSALAPRPPT